MEGKRRIAVAGVLVVLAGAGLTAMAGCSSDDGEPAPVAESSEQGATGKQESASKAGDAQVGRYVDYSPELVASTPGTKLLFFHAPWCSQCVALEDDIEAKGLPEGVTVFKVDYDSNQDLRQEYGVTIQTTIVEVDEDGNELDSYVAYEDPTFDSVSAALLN
jgi:thiol-disulfide isomerase/thioredoxin